MMICCYFLSQQNAKLISESSYSKSSRRNQVFHTLLAATTSERWPISGHHHHHAILAVVVVVAATRHGAPQSSYSTKSYHRANEISVICVCLCTGNIPVGTALMALKQLRINGRPATLPPRPDPSPTTRRPESRKMPVQRYGRKERDVSSVNTKAYVHLAEASFRIKVWMSGIWGGNAYHQGCCGQLA